MTRPIALHGLLCLAVCACGPATSTGPDQNNPCAGGDFHANPDIAPDNPAGQSPADLSTEPPADSWTEANDPAQGQPAQGQTDQPADNPDEATNNAPVDGPAAAMLAAHNRYRRDHCAPPLRWSEKLARVAQTWADTLNKRGCVFEHSPDSRYGENLAFYSPPQSADASTVVSGWYKEIAKYNFKKPGFSFETGHFTQVVWKRTTELGCAMTTCNNAAIWVCNYNPPGNFRRQYRDNVAPSSCSR